MSKIDTFKAMLEKGQDNALLRYSLGSAYFSDKQFESATEHLASAVQQDEGYSAAWKMLGRSYVEAGDYLQAITTLERGIDVAVEKGDKQAEKEMTVFLRRAKKLKEQDQTG